MKYISALCRIVALTIPLLISVTTVSAFSDAGGSQYATSIDRLEERGLVEGYKDGTFRPFDNINRAEFLKLMMRASSQRIVEGESSCFSDVGNEWFAPYVCTAKELGIIQGYADGTFRAGESINMVEAMKLTSVAFSLSIKSPQEGAAWYDPYRNFFHDNTILSKYTYIPGRSLRREEMAYVMDRLFEAKEGRSSLTSVRNVGSAGCGQNPPAQAPTVFDINGTERSAIVRIPANYDPNTPAPLLFAFHGRTNSNARVQGYYGFERRGIADNAIIIYPAGNKVGASYNWSNTYPFFDKMYHEFTSSYCVNVDEVYAVGHSLGGWIANDLGCARGYQLRAIATLGGGRNERNCNGPTAAMVWHNPKDRLAPFSGGERARDLFLTQNQADFNADPAAPSWAHCIKYRGGHTYAPVLWCPHTNDTERDGTYYPHNWPRDTGKEMWSFFKGL